MQVFFVDANIVIFFLFYETSQYFLGCIWEHIRKGRKSLGHCFLLKFKKLPFIQLGIFILKAIIF